MAFLFFSSVRRRTRIIGIFFILGIVIVLSSFCFPAISDLCEEYTRDYDISKKLPLPFSDNPHSKSPMVCFVTRVYGKQLGYLRVLALGLFHTELDNIHILVVNTDKRTNVTRLVETVKLINDLVARTDYVVLIDLGAPSRRNDFGYGLTDRVLLYLYKQHAQFSSICEYVIFTNGDNFYSQSLGSKILPHMIAKKDIIAWGFISRYSVPPSNGSISDENHSAPRIIDDGSQRCMKVALRTGDVDLGAVAYRLEFLRRHNLQFCRPNEAYYPLSDGKFVERAARLTNATVLLRQILFIHQ